MLDRRRPIGMMREMTVVVMSIPTAFCVSLFGTLALLAVL